MATRSDRGRFNLQTRWDLRVRVGVEVSTSVFHQGQRQTMPHKQTECKHAVLSSLSAQKNPLQTGERPCKRVSSKCLDSTRSSAIGASASTRQSRSSLSLGSVGAFVARRIAEFHGGGSGAILTLRVLPAARRGVQYRPARLTRRRSFLPGQRAPNHRGISTRLEFLLAPYGC